MNRTQAETASTPRFEIDPDALHIAELLSEGRTEDAMEALREWVESVRHRCDRGSVDPAQLQSYARSTAWLGQALEQAKSRTAHELLQQRTRRPLAAGGESPGWVDVSK